MSVPYVTGVISNIKGGVRTRLGSKTLICGPNGSGKSAVVQALELALSGRVSDLAGRDLVAREADLLALAPNREGTIFAEVELSDGSTVRWESVGEAGKARKGKGGLADPETCFPLRAVMEAVLGSPQTARKFFLSYACAPTAEEILRYIPASLHRLFGVAVPAGSQMAVDKLLLALEVSRERARRATAEAKAARHIANTNAQGIIPVNDAQIERAVAEVAAASKALQQAGMVLAAREAEQRAKTELPHLAERKRTLLDEIIQVEKQIAAIPQSDARAELRAAALSLLRAQPGDACTLCESPVERALVEQRIKFLEDRVHGEEERERLLLRLDALKHTALTISNRFAELNRSIVVVDGPLPSEAQGWLERAQAELTRLKTLQSLWRQVKQAEETAIEMERAAGEWKMLVDACELAVARLLDSGVKEFEQRVQKFLPASDVFSLRLREGAREVVQFGLVRNGVLHTALSGAEWARVTAALAAACAPKTGLSVIVPRPGEFDPKTLSTLLEAFSAVESQVILTSPIEPERVPEGWVVLQTTRDDTRRKAAKSVETSVDSRFA